MDIRNYFFEGAFTNELEKEGKFFYIEDAELPEDLEEYLFELAKDKFKSLVTLNTQLSEMTYGNKILGIRVNSEMRTDIGYDYETIQFTFNTSDGKLISIRT